MTEYIIELIKELENKLDDLELDLEDATTNTYRSFILNKKYTQEKINFLQRLISILVEMSKDYDKK